MYYNNKMYEAYIIDTGDYIILAFILKDLESEIILEVTALYEQMGISIDVTKLTNVQEVHKDVRDFIREICGRIIGRNQICEIKNDVGKCVEFYKIKKYWARNINVPAPQQLEQLAEEPNCTELHCTSLHTAFDTTLLPAGWEKYGSHQQVDSTLQCNIMNDNSHKSCILFNNTNNISLFVSNLKFMQIICEEFTDFEIADTIDTWVLEKDVLKAYKSLFDKKSHSSMAQLKEMIVYFKKLYNVETNNPVSSFEEFCNEKQKVMSFVKSMYVLDNDPTHKMGATELYEKIAHNVTFSDIGKFKKRVIGYLLELGLTRKRYSDGYFYYGLVPKYETCAKTSSVDDIAKKRDNEKISWFTQGDPPI